MLDAHRRALRPESRIQLHLTARIGGPDHVRSRARHVLELLAEDPRRHRGLERAVQTGCAAAEVRVSHLDELDTGYGTDKVARLLPDALSVREVARVLVRHPHLHLTLGSGQSDLGQPLRPILDTPLELWVEVFEV